MKLKPNIQTETLRDKRASTLRAVIEALEPLRHYKALHKTNDALKALDVHFNRGNPAHLWFWIEHGTERYGGAKRNLCEYYYYPPQELGREWKDRGMHDVNNLYVWMQYEYAREAAPYEPRVYDSDLWSFVAKNLGEHEMHREDWQRQRELVVKALEKALAMVKALTPEGMEVEDE